MKQAFGMYEDMKRSSLSLSVSVSIYEDMRETVVCPKPRRLGLLSGNDPVRPLRWHFCHQSDPCESKTGTDLLDIIHPKGGHGAENPYVLASSPPFFSGSPPSRVSNPLIHDSHFVDNKLSPLSPRSIPIPSGQSLSTSSSSSRMGGCVRASFGDNPAVRIEGFDCLDRDRRNCSIPTLA